MDAFGYYIDDCVHLFATIFVADVLLRFHKALWEYIKYKNHYLPEDRLKIILFRAYSYNVATMVVYVSIFAVAVVRAGLPPAKYFLYMPVLWLFCLARLEHSTLDYATFIRGNHGLDSASSMAANFFHGYLKQILAQYNNSTGIRERIAHYEQTHGVKFALDRLVVLLSSQLYISSKFESPYIEKAEPLPKVYINRAGVYRPYQNDVYRFTKPINNRFYYLALEGATPILTFFEALNFPLTRTKEIEIMKREILLKFCKYLRKLVFEWPETEAQIELIFYDDRKPNGEKQDIGEMLFTHFESLMLKKDMLKSNGTTENIANDKDDMAFTL
ncbi:PREDICTED: uncharacterized protein LOC108360535 [Rhagoletis zephyria]|uniref:uncharacterized protein LOC108360535 n=1 Tax=Rhagoletis zephyria TaxID=28612 RepID=UPI0008115180|nr:PREDICTED: uncharacterized protein LOC108360535 [Rhagoletis zephyria]XP_017468357.1 PREDICTED: uncharacterized protein LOC108360535 [Rhagoletis zephyria]XP_036334236.1 uncharacterized protein LOC118744915 [Rhagoletis pomonella]